ncbi:hypothetical protein ACOV11_22720 [Vibrio natriegens]
MSLKNKNIILGSVSHIFVNLYIDVLVNKCGCPKESICIASIDQCDIPSDLEGVKVMPFTSISGTDFNECKTITAISLGSHNSFYLAKVINSSDVLDKLYIHLTDDEVARWLKTQDEHGELKPTKTNRFDDDCVFVLNHVKNIIAPRDYFQHSIQSLTGRADLTFIDARDAFKSLPTKLWERFADVYSNGGRHTDSEKRIMIGAKRGVFPLSKVISLIHNLKKERVVPEYTLVVFTYKKRKYFRVLLDVYLGYLRHFRGCNIDVSYPTATNSVTYNALIMSCSHLLLQKRGSMSTARSYLSLGRGVVHIESGSPNHIELSKSEHIAVSSYSTMKDVAKNITNGAICPIKNSEQMNKRFDYKYSVLRNIYC